MLKTNFIIAYRNFIRNKVFSLINVLGLAIGISSSLVIFLIVHYDFNFDKFENNREQLYRVVTESKFYASLLHDPGVPSPMAAAVKKEVSGLEEVIGFHQYNGDPKVTVSKKDNEKAYRIRHQSGVIWADKSYFKMVPYEWLAGSRQMALEEPFRVVLTAER